MHYPGQVIGRGVLGESVAAARRVVAISNLTEIATTNSPISAPAAPTMAAAKIVHLSGSNIERDLVSDVAGSNQAKLACPFDG